MRTIKLVKPDEETVEFIMNDKFITSFNHDDIGWVGLDAYE